MLYLFSSLVSVVLVLSHLLEKEKSCILLRNPLFVSRKLLGNWLVLGWVLFYGHQTTYEDAQCHVITEAVSQATNANFPAA